MTKNLNPLEINEYILKAARKKENVFKSFKNLCESEKTNFDYVDFEWKYFQFYHGNRDLTIEKSPQNSSSVTFDHLPLDVLEKVAENLKLFDRFALGKVSADLRESAFDAKAYCEEVALRFRLNYVQMREGDQIIAFRKDRENCMLEWKNYINEYELDADVWKTEKLESWDIPKAMVEHVATFLKNPRLEIGTFEAIMGNDEKVNTRFINFLNSLKFKIRAEKLSVRETTVAGHANAILKHLEPSKLKEIRLESAYWKKEFLGEMDEFLESAHLTNAEFFEWIQMPDDYPIEKLFHLKKFEIRQMEFKEEHVVKIRDILLKSANFESCKLKMTKVYKKDEVRERAAGEPNMEWIDRIMSQDPAYNSDTHRYSIPDSENYFQLEFDKYFKFDGMCVKALTITKTLVD